jgi:hypothetical protein
MFQADGTTYGARISSTGDSYVLNNFGIGATSPEQKLHVEGRGIFDGGASSDILQIRNDNGGGVFGMTSNLFALDLASTSAFRIRQGSSVPLYLKSNGNFGIGTTNPGNLLDVAGDTDITGQLVVSHDVNYVAKFVNTATSMSNNNYALMVNNSSHTSNMTAAGAMAVDVNSGRAFTINGIGRVSIGGDLQSANTLTLTGSATEFDINNTSGKRYRFNCDTSGNLKFEDKTGGTEVMRFASSNNVGINETAPAAKLQVSGDRDGNSEYVAILGEDGGANGTANNNTSVPVHKTLLTGYSIPYSGQSNSRLTSVGFLEFDSTPGWTGNQRNYALTNGYDMGGTGGPKFAILMGDTQNVEPQLGINGTVGSSSGQGANTRICSYWDNGGNMTIPEGGLFVKGFITGDTNNANRAVNYLRTITVPYTGSSGSFTFDIDPVAEFGNRVSGGRMKLEVSGWQSRMNAGYIVYRNDGSGAGKIGTGNVTYYRYIWSETSGSQAMVSVSLPSSSTNVIRISFSGWHGNDHGFEARLTAPS